MILCGGSATDLPEQGRSWPVIFIRWTVFDTHAHIPDYFNTMKSISRGAWHLALISCGWDPGLFSIMRTVFGSILRTARIIPFGAPASARGIQTRYGGFPA
jgi:diaminopimelate dehydrogenase